MIFTGEQVEFARRLLDADATVAMLSPTERKAWMALTCAERRAVDAALEARGRAFQAFYGSFGDRHALLQMGLALAAILVGVDDAEEVGSG